MPHSLTNEIISRKGPIVLPCHNSFSVTVFCLRHSASKAEVIFLYDAFEWLLVLKNDYRSWGNNMAKVLLPMQVTCHDDTDPPKADVTELNLHKPGHRVLERAWHYYRGREKGLQNPAGGQNIDDVAILAGEWGVTRWYHKAVNFVRWVESDSAITMRSNVHEVILEWLRNTAELWSLRIEMNGNFAWYLGRD